jgi:hypothetical protein
MYSINGEEFKTKESLKRLIQQILHAYQPEHVLNETDYRFMLGVLDMHHSSDIKKGVGIQSIFVRENPTYKRNRGFWIKRIDGTVIDFSFIEFISPRNNKTRFNSACRNAIREDIVLFKNQNLKHDSICPITGVKLTRDNVHVDHSPPNTFDFIVKEFIKSEYLIVKHVKLVETDEIIGGCFDSKSLSMSFVAFHNSKADLRLVSAKANLSDIKLKENQRTNNTIPNFQE